MHLINTIFSASPKVPPRNRRDKFDGTAKGHDFKGRCYNGQVEGRKGDTLCGTTPLTKKGLGESVHFVVISKTPGYYLPRSQNTFLSPFSFKSVVPA